ncbi:MAG: hypothetical protein HS111_12935 [Kofleriaceae bacterium]|nr:hypothetical protein [Kofleriaceae bacterium]
MPVRADPVGGPRRQWTQAALVGELRRLHERGVRITSQALLAAGEAKVLGAIDRLIGSIAQARALAQLELVPRRPRELERWSAARVIAAILARDRASASLATSRVPRKLREAAITWCGSWREAVERAGLDYAATRLKPVPRPARRIRRELRQLAAAQPDLTRAALRRNHPSAPPQIRRYGRHRLTRRWRAPASSAGPARRRDARRARPAAPPGAAARARVSALRASTEGAEGGAGSSAAARSMRACSGAAVPELRRTACAGPGGLNGARVLLGRPPERQRWTRARLAAELRARHRAGLPLAPETLRREAPALHAAARRLMGSVTRAVTELVRTAEDVPIRHGAKLVALIRMRKRDGKSLEARDVPSRLRGAARRYFGGWTAALAAAGLVVEDEVARRTWSDAELVLALRALARDRPEMTRSELHRSRVGAAAASRFGSLARALSQAKLARWPRRLHRPLPGRDDVVRLLRLRRARGEALTMAATRRDELRGVKAALAHFGTWRAALAAAGLGGGDPAT